MIDLIVYDRAESRLLSERSYDDASIGEANADRLSFELAHAGSSTVEIVILRARTREEMLVTHGRYFKSLPDLLRMHVKPSRD